MAKTTTLPAEMRLEAANVVRRNGNIPAVLYGHGVVPVALKVDYQKFSKVLREAGTTSLVKLKVGEEERAVIIREVQHHPVKDQIIHTDFYQVRLDETLRASVPFEFIGEAPAVKDLGGVLVRNLDEIEVEALPQNMPHDVKIDISVLKNFEQMIRLEDVNLPEGVAALEAGETVIALVQPPRSDAELEALDEEVKEDVAGVEGVEAKPAEDAAEGEEAKVAGAEDQKSE